MQTVNKQIFEKWIEVISRPIEPNKATAIIGQLYQRIGYPSPKIVFVDSPFATSIAAELLFHQFSALNPVREDLCNLFKKVYTQLLRQYLKNFNPSLFYWNDWNIKSNRMDAVDLAGQLSDIAATKIYDRIYDDEEADDIWYGYPQTQLDELSGLATSFPYSDHRVWKYRWSDDVEPHLLGTDLNNNWIAKLLYNLKHRLVQQLDVQIDEFSLDAVYPFTVSKPIWCSSVTDAAVFDLAACNGVQFEPQLLTLFLETAEHLSYIKPFEEICFVSERPHFQRDAQNKLHAEGEPAIIFPDSFGMDYFYHGIKLPQYVGIVHPSQWQPQWILQEQNAEVRRCLIQEIDYARMCQELQAEELDTWREYTLLKLAIFDDYTRTLALDMMTSYAKVEADVMHLKSLDRIGVDAIYLLKMTCPSTKCIYAIRVPPNMCSAREAVTWINWSNDPESFALET